MPGKSYAEIQDTSRSVQSCLRNQSRRIGQITSREKRATFPPYCCCLQGNRPTLRRSLSSTYVCCARVGVECSYCTLPQVSEYTGFPEMMDGRVKTLHPSVHGGIMHVRGNEEHEEAMKSQGMKVRR